MLIDHAFVYKIIAAQAALKRALQDGPVNKILIANRGVCALVFAEACEALGVEFVIAVEPGDELKALERFNHVMLTPTGAGPSAAAKYGNPEAIITAAQAEGCDTVVPGWGYLSENGDFVARCEKVGLTFVGPPSVVHQKLGDKDEGKKIAQNNSVPVIPGISVPDTGPDGDETAAVQAIKEAISSGTLRYPILLKATAGGGGKGQAEIHHEDEIASQLAIIRSQATHLWDDSKIIVEQLFPKVRHVEVQVFRDQHGNCHALRTRDCSSQRGRQKIIEEAPAPNLPDGVEDGMMQNAKDICNEVGYVGAGTVEFILDEETGKYYFLEVNTRLQVEYPVTEKIFGLDLPKALIRIANGESLATIFPAELKSKGHAFELRILAERVGIQEVDKDGKKVAKANFGPTSGVVQDIVWASDVEGVTVDCGLSPGDPISPQYDSMVAKVTIYGTDREDVRAKAIRFLEGSRVVSQSVVINRENLLNVLRSEAFTKSTITTTTIEADPDQYCVHHFQLSTDEAIDKLCVHLADLAAGEVKVPGRDPSIPFPDVTLDTSKLDAVLEGAQPSTSRWWNLLEQDGPEALVEALLRFRNESGALWTLLTNRDSQQSSIQDRAAVESLLTVAEYYSRIFGENLISDECDGGAVPQVSTRFLWERAMDRTFRFRDIHQKSGVLPQMLARAVNAVAYANIPKNQLEFVYLMFYIAGVRWYRSFDSLNDVDNLKLAMDVIKRLGTAAGVYLLKGLADQATDLGIEAHAEDIAELVTRFKAGEDVDPSEIASDLRAQTSNTVVNDTLDQIENLRHGPVAETGISYTTDDIDTPPGQERYTIDYWKIKIDAIMENCKPNVFVFKDMASQFTPETVTELAEYIVSKYPQVPIHLHPHNNSAQAVAVARAFVKAGGHIVDFSSDGFYDTHASLTEFLVTDWLTDAIGDNKVLDLTEILPHLAPGLAERVATTLANENPDLNLFLGDLAGEAVDAIRGAFEGRIVDKIDDGDLAKRPNMAALPVSLDKLREFDALVAQVRKQSSPFEVAGLTPEETLASKMPGGQWTNLASQAKANGVDVLDPEHGPENRALLLKAYRVARVLMGSPPLVTPSSKVAGEIAIRLLEGFATGNSLLKIGHLNQNVFEIADGFMAEFMEKPDAINWPDSAKGYYCNMLGHPPFGYPDFVVQLRAHYNLAPVEGIPAETLPPFDIEAEKLRLTRIFGTGISDFDVAMSSMFIRGNAHEYDDVLTHRYTHGPVENLSPRLRFDGLKFGETADIPVRKDPKFGILEDRVARVTYVARQQTMRLPNGVEVNIRLDDGGIQFEVNGHQKRIRGQWEHGEKPENMTWTVDGITVEFNGDQLLIGDHGDQLTAGWNSEKGRFESEKLTLIITLDIDGKPRDYIYKGFRKPVDDRDVATPAPGKLVQWFKKPGEDVNPRDDVAEVEIMKMYIILRAKHRGTVRHYAESGAQLQKGEAVFRVEQHSKKLSDESDSDGEGTK